MGKEMTKENAVMAESSMFIISSFFAFRASISSRVMSRDSIEDKSTPFFLPMAKATVVVPCERARGATKALVVGTMAKAMESATIQTKRRDMMISTSPTGFKMNVGAKYTCRN